MKRPRVKFSFIPILLIGLIMAMIPTVEDAYGKCRWVWRGTQSYLECDNGKSRHNRESICDYTTSRDRTGTPVSITTFCRPDGSPWKRIIVKPHQVVVNWFKHDGSPAGKEEYPSISYEPTPRQTARPGVPPLPSSLARIRYMGHFEGYGDSKFVNQANILGDPNRQERLEGFRINTIQNSQPIKLRYMAHVSRMGDTKWIAMGKFCGTRGQGRAVEGIAIDRVGKRWKHNFDVFYRVHIKRKGWTDWCANGAFCGTRGKGHPVNAIQIFIADR